MAAFVVPLRVSLRVIGWLLNCISGVLTMAQIDHPLTCPCNLTRGDLFWEAATGSQMLDVGLWLARYA